jgi:trk system potassium uptake protein TrkH
MPSQLSGSSGIDTLLQRARVRVLLLTLAKHGILAPMLFGPPMAWAALEGAGSLALSLAAPSTLGLALWALVWRKPLPRDLRSVEAMACVALLFLFTAAGGVPAFMALGMPPAAAFFEAMSAVTTTGLSAARTPDDWPMAAHILRSWMQWCGGLAMATAVLALLLSAGSASARMGRAGIDVGDRLQSSRAQARELLGVYTALTFLCLVPIMLTVPAPAEALALTLSAVSTGGFAPRSDSLASYTPLAQTFIILACLLGAVSLLTFGRMFRRRFRAAWNLGSLRRVLTALAILGAFYSGAHLIAGSGSLWPALLNLASALSTAGFSTAAMPTAPLLLLVLVVAMIAGADHGSTGGGLKLSRLATFLRAMRHALRLPRLPDRAVAPLREAGEVVSDMRLATLLGLLVLYMLSVLLVWAMLLALGFAPLPALFDTVSALSTVGLSTGVISADLPPSALMVLSLAMWLGRLEFIAVLVLFLPRTWFHITLKG